MQFKSWYLHAKLYVTLCSVLLIILQLYFPGFLKSSVYLRFLNELVVTLNRPANQPSITPATKGPSEVTSHLEKSDQIDFAQNLDDPDSLWQRPPTVYETGRCF